MGPELFAAQFDTLTARHFGGAVQTYSLQIHTAIPAQWVACNDARLRVAGGGNHALGFSYDAGDESSDYRCGQEVRAGAPGASLEYYPPKFDGMTGAGG